MTRPPPDASGLQPEGVVANGGISAGLGEFETSSQARRLERLADAEIVLRLQLQGFDPESPEWQELQNALIEYGFEVFRVWAVTGRLRARAFQHAGGRGVLGKERIPEDLQLSPEQGIGLSIDLNMTSIEAFRIKTLANPSRTWRINGGASIKTYYTGRCLMELPDVYEKWKQEDTFDVDLIGIAALDPDHAMTGGEPDPRTDEAANRSELRALIAASVPDQEAREIFQYMDQGFSQEEIAELMGERTGRHFTIGAVESKLYRARKDAGPNRDRAMREPT